MMRAALLLVVVVVGPAACELSTIDRTRDNIVRQLVSLAEKTRHPEWDMVARARAMTPIQYLIERVAEIAPVDKVNDPVSTLRPLSSVWLWARVDSKARVVRGMYGTLYTALGGYNDPELYSEQWEAVANTAPANSKEALDLIHKAITDGYLYLQLLKEFEENLCGIQQSPKQLIYNLYNSLQMTQLKAYTMMQYSWMYKYKNNASSNSEAEAKVFHELYIEHLEQQAESVKEALQRASQEMWRCDPREPKEGETYTRLTRFLQGFILNEVDMNDKETCGENCAFYQHTKQYGCFKNNFCSKQPTCKGSVVNCRYVDSDMWICPAEQYTSKTDRRYEWIKYENGRVLGEEKTCRRGVTKVDSWWRWLFWHCSYCFCICDEKQNPMSDRYFSLKSSLADVDNNRVLTGLRMVKENKVIHIQGQEGKLLQEGVVDQASLGWIPLEPVSLDKDKENIEYFKMSWEQRVIDLDDLLAPEGHIITGVKWKKLGTHLNLEAHVCMFNFTTGKLVEGGKRCQWISNDNTDAVQPNPRRKLELTNPQVPTKIRVPSRKDSTTDQFIEFTHSDINADAGQSAVPFIDIQPAAPVPACPLQGIGIFHKGLHLSGGYIAPKVFTLDHLPFIQTNFSKLK